MGTIEFVATGFATVIWFVTSI